MLHTTQGIVLSHIKYRETSIIVKVFTKALGGQTYLVQGVRTAKPKHCIALFQPLTLLDLVVYHKKQASLQRVSEVKCHTPIHGILGNLPKAAIAVFLAELLTKVVREEESNEALFDFLWQSVLDFNERTAHYTLFHLSFMLQLCPYLGFGVKHGQEIYTQLRQAGHHWAMDAQEVRWLDALLAGDVASLDIDKATQRRLLAGVLRFYQLHLDSLATLKSLEVLQTLG